MVLLLCVVRARKRDVAAEGALGGAIARTFWGISGCVEIDEGPGSETLISDNQGA